MLKLASRPQPWSTWFSTSEDLILERSRYDTPAFDDRLGMRRAGILHEKIASIDQFESRINCLQTYTCLF